MSEDRVNLTFGTFLEFVAQVARANEIEGNLASLEAEIKTRSAERDKLNTEVSSAQKALERAQADEKASRASAAKIVEDAQLRAKADGAKIVEDAKTASGAIWSENSRLAKVAKDEETATRERIKDLASDVADGEKRLAAIKSAHDAFKKAAVA